MRYADIKEHDINNGIGTRVSLWVTGCPIQCPGCHNEAVFNKEVGKLYTSDTQDYIIELLKNPDIDKHLSILGGEPLAIWNYEEVLGLCKTVKSLMPEKTIWLWTGYPFEQVQAMDIMKYLDVVVDGNYIQSLHDHDTWWRGSSNQRMFKLEDGKATDITHLTD